MSYYITRIFNNKLKLGVILFIFAAPILDILMALVDVFKGASVPVPGLVTFLGSFMTAGLQGVLTGFYRCSWQLLLRTIALKITE